MRPLLVAALLAAASLRQELSPALADNMPFMGVGGGGSGGIVPPPGLLSLLSFDVGSTAAVSAAAVTYAVPGPSGYSTVTRNALETGMQWVMPVAGKIKNLSSLRPGATTVAGPNYFKFQLRKGLTTTLTSLCDESVLGQQGGANPFASCADAANSDTIAPGDVIGLLTTPTGTPAGGLSFVAVTALFLSTAPNEQPLLGGTISPMSSATTGQMSGFQSTTASVVAGSEALVMWGPSPTAVAIDHLYIHARVAPGGANGVNIDTVTIRKIPGCVVGSAADTALVASVTGAALDGNDGGIPGPVALAAGDCVSAKYTSGGSTGTPAASSLSYGVRVVTTGGESVYAGNVTTQNSSVSTTRYYALEGNSQAGGISTSNVLGLYLPPALVAATMQKFRFQTDAAATGSQTRTLTPRYSTYAGTFTITDMTGLACSHDVGHASACNSGAATATPSIPSFLDLKVVNDATAAPAAGTWSKFAFSGVFN